MELFVWGHQTQGRQEARKKRAVTLKALERRTNSLLLLEGGGQEDNKSMPGANHIWRCVKSYSILLWERGVRRIMMWGQSLESKSPEGQSPEAESHAVQQSDLILKGARVQCLVSRDFKTANPRSSPERRESSAESLQRLESRPVLCSYVISLSINYHFH